MALGGGTFTAQNKILPGTYINFVSVPNNRISLSERGIVAIGLALDWGTKGELVTVETRRLPLLSEKYFGYKFDDPEMLPIREMSRNATKIVYTRLNDGTKATNKFAEAKCGGTIGNKLAVRIQSDPDNDNGFIVETLKDGIVVDKQKVENTKELDDNDWLTWKEEAVLEVTAATPLASGTSEEVTGQDHEDFLKKLESQFFNVLVCDVTDEETKKIYADYTKRMRDEVGKKFQLVVAGLKADHEGIVNVKQGEELVHWVGGALAGCEVQNSTVNKIYDGEIKIDDNLSQFELEDAIAAGEYTFHLVGDEYRVLADVNSLTTLTDEKGKVFQKNQTIRVIDQIANDIAERFNNYFLGKVPNNEDGRISLWSQIVDFHRELEEIQAIEDFDPDDITVEQGVQKEAVYITDVITVTNAMEKLYMVVQVA